MKHKISKSPKGKTFLFAVPSKPNELLFWIHRFKMELQRSSVLSKKNPLEERPSLERCSVQYRLFVFEFLREAACGRKPQSSSKDLFCFPRRLWWFSYRTRMKRRHTGTTPFNVSVVYRRDPYFCRSLICLLNHILWVITFLLLQPKKYRLSTE